MTINWERKEERKLWSHLHTLISKKSDTPAYMDWSYLTGLYAYGKQANNNSENRPEDSHPGDFFCLRKDQHISVREIVLRQRCWSQNMFIFTDLCLTVELCNSFYQKWLMHLYGSTPPIIIWSKMILDQRRPPLIPYRAHIRKFFFVLFMR